MDDKIEAVMQYLGLWKPGQKCPPWTDQTAMQALKTHNIGYELSKIGDSHKAVLWSPRAPVFNGGDGIDPDPKYAILNAVYELVKEHRNDVE